MKAAVVHSFVHPPRYEDIEDPVANGPSEVVVDVLAAGLHPRVRSQADGSHYTSTAELPLVPGIDGVVRDHAGRARYVILDETTRGTLAERTVIDVERSVLLPDGVDPVQVAAAMNPAMSSWMALRRRVELPPDARVLVLGATGNAGRLAVQVARRLGAAEVVAAGRSPERLTALPVLGADRTLLLDDLAAAAEVDVVLDYLWGPPTARALVDVLTNRRDRGRTLTWIEIGAVAGPEASIPAAALRSARLKLVGSGIGSVARHDFIEELPALAATVTDGTFVLSAEPTPLADVEAVWTSSAGTSDRIVFVP
jgi:NADPH:quinone reductase-like Zn-dependent oxidoreductase